MTRWGTVLEKLVVPKLFKNPTHLIETGSSLTRSHNSSPLVPILRQINPIHDLSSYLISILILYRARGGAVG
jgi:hypothetical protein